MRALLCAALGFCAGWAMASWRLSRRERLRARFLSFVAHEINTPVSALTMTVHNFMNGLFGPLPEELKPWLVLMREQVVRMGALAGDLRDLVHVEFHRDLHLNLEPVSVGALVQEGVAAMKDALARSGAEVHLSLAEGLPAASGDPDRLQRVVSAMLTHARKFRARDVISVRAEADAAFVRLRVEFTGNKVPPEQAAHALELFYPVYHPESQVLSSVGLGLGLPCRLLEAHGGGMTLSVEPDGRCRVEMRLPREDAGAQPPGGGRA